jgi:hypothetical protein
MTYKISTNANNYQGTYTVSSGLTTAQMPTITLQNLQGLNLSNSLSSGIQWDELRVSSKYHDSVKKYEVYESPEDVLALSVTWKRLNKTNPSILASVSNLLSKELFMHVTDEDRELGQEIRDYYSKKIMIWKLKNARFSKFRDELNAYIHSPTPLLVKNDLMGMIYYLPYFYEYDTGVDDVRVQVNSKTNVILQMGSSLPRTLKPLSKIISKRKSATTHHYWFKDVETETAVQFVFELSNPLEHIWAKLFAKNEPMEITGLYHKKSRDDFEYYSVKNWKLENI